MAPVGGYTPLPGKETLEAMLEAEKLSCDPNTKHYHSFQKAYE